jgi:hypothetical protein
MASPFDFLGNKFGNAASAAFAAPPQMTAPRVQVQKGPTTGAYQGTGAPQFNVTGGADAYGVRGSFDSNALGGAMPQQPGGPMQAPGNNLTNPGYGEQAFDYTQNRLLEDPYAQQTQDQYQQTQNPSQGESYLNQNLGSLDGPGTGEQYWNQVQGQYQNPFAGEQYARQATQSFQANGPASAFNDQAQGQYDDFANYQGGQNTQGQYGQSSASLAGGSQGERGLGQIAGQAGAKSTYSGPNNAAGQYQQNAASGPMAAQSYYDQQAGQQATKGTYSDPNRAAGQYDQTQQAFGDLPIANFDPFYDRAEQLGVQNYNRQSAGRGVYGSSEALSGVGNVITDIEAQRANRSFDAEMQRAVEQRNRQELLGNQARMGDLSGLGAFAANLDSTKTYGDLANNAGNQTLAQQTMLGTQARNADISATDAFNQNLQGATTFANINNQLGNQELDRNRLLGDLANNADSQQTAGQNSRVSGLNALSNAASNADNAETNRYQASTTAMNNADRTGLDRMNTGAENAFRVDDTNRANYTAGASAASDAARINQDRTRLGADIASTGSRDDLARVNAFNETAQGAESQRQARQIAKLDSVRSLSQDLQNMIGQGLSNVIGGSQADYENWFQSEMMPALTKAGYDQKKIDGIRSDIGTAIGVGEAVASSGASAAPAAAAPKPKQKGKSTESYPE